MSLEKLLRSSHGQDTSSLLSGWLRLSRPHGGQPGAQSEATPWGWESQFDSHCSFSPLIFSAPLPSLNPLPPPLQAAPSSTDSDTRKHFQAFLMHTSYPEAGWENRCQQSTTHPPGKEPDGTSNEQQVAHQPTTPASFPWNLQHEVHIAIRDPQRRAGGQVQRPVRGTLHSVQCLPLPRPCGESHNWKGRQHNAQPQTFLWGSAKHSRSSPSCSLQPWKVSANGNILIVLETILEPKKRFP